MIVLCINVVERLVDKLIIRNYYDVVKVCQDSLKTSQSKPSSKNFSVLLNLIVSNPEIQIHEFW